MTTRSRSNPKPVFPSSAPPMSALIPSTTSSRATGRASRRWRRRSGSFARRLSCWSTTTIRRPGLSSTPLAKPRPGSATAGGTTTSASTTSTRRRSAGARSRSTAYPPRERPWRANPQICPPRSDQRLRPMRRCSMGHASDLPLAGASRPRARPRIPSGRIVWLWERPAGHIGRNPRKLRISCTSECTKEQLAGGSSGRPPVHPFQTGWSSGGGAAP